MKKVSLILLSIATVGSMMFVGCKKDTQTVTLGVKLESAAADGKLYIDGDRNPVFLESGEQINVNGQTYSVVKNGSNYNVTVNGGNPFYAAYPATLPTASTGFSGTSNQPVRLSRWQKYECDANGIQNVKLPAAAVIDANSSDTNKLLFYNLCSLLEIQWTNASDAAYDIIGIEVTVPGQALYGNGIATLDGTSSEITMDAPITNNRVNLDIANNYRETVAAGAASRKYYVVLPTFSNKNVTVRIQTLKHDQTTADDQELKTVTVSTDNAVTLLRNTIVPMHISATPKEDNSLTGYFSISRNLKVVFSRGNLQHVGSTSHSDGTWKFADRQYDFFGASNYTTSGGYTSSNTRDLFTWSNKRRGDYGLTLYDSWNDDNPPSESFLEWGKKSIKPSTNSTTVEANVWFTLTDAEWQYLINERVEVNGTSKARQLRGKATITGIINHPAGFTSVNGFILLPDDWETEDVPQGLTFVYNGNNSYTVAQWARMEAAGAMFLPAAGWADIYGQEGNYFEASNDEGSYWSSSNKTGYGDAWNLYFKYSTNVFTRESSYDNEYYIQKSVRLVKAAPGYTVPGRWN